jgi:hypothetical protein
VVIALFAGGAIELRTHEVAVKQAAQTPPAAKVLTTPAVSRHHAESAALRYVVDSSFDLAEHIAHAVRPPEAVEAPRQALVTHYGESYNGQVLGCGTGYYDSNNPTIVAVGPALYGQMPCGTLLQICGAGGCIIAKRQDACPGCVASLFDLSESAFAGVCGQPSGVCSATVVIVKTCDALDLGWEDRLNPGESEEALWLDPTTMDLLAALDGASFDSITDRCSMP